MLPHAVVQIGGYAYVEFSLFFNDVDKPFVHGTLMHAFEG